ncbi:unnamed protein product [Urochloa humidicola]
MEGTALSLAKLTLETVLPVAKQAIANDALLLLGVRQEVSFITNELEMMQAFLRAADTSDRARNEVVKIWVQQVRDLAYDVEDCLQEYLALDLVGGGSLCLCCRWAGGLGLGDSRHRSIAARIREAKAGVEEVSKRNLRYSIVVQPGPVVDPAGREHDISISPTFADDVAAEECSLVGRGAQRAELVARLLPGGDSPLRVLAVWGMGGMGKTVLVRDVLRSPEVAEAFQCRAWVTVPRPFTTAEFLHALVTQLDMEASGGASAASSVKRVQTRAEYSAAMRRVARHLDGKRYVVVVDDVASVAAEWESIRRVLPDSNTGSWVIVTTRHEDIAKHCSTTLPSQPYQLNHLSSEDSLQLLFIKAQIKHKHALSEELIGEANQILQRCCGLPLAVAAIGGLLATKPRAPMEWKKLHDHLGSELRANPGLEETKNVLTSSYNALPYHLKSCFLYLSVFPRHREMLQTRMVWRWMAEGLIVRSRDMVPEDVGELYFNQLIGRSMIQPVTNWVNLNNRIKTCQVHDLMREIILANSIEENHLLLLDEQSSNSSSTWALPSDKVRHLVVITGAGGRHGRQDTSDALQSINLSHVRSVTVVGDRVPSLSILSKMRMLRVLDLEDCPSAKDTDLKRVGELRHLKYLGLRRTNIAELPAALGRLKFLQTLDLRGTKVTVLPQGVTSLEKLRHLLAGSDMSNYGHTSTAVRRQGTSAAQLDPRNGVRLPQGIEKLRNLHECGRINVGQGAQRTLNDIGKMAGLHYLGVTDLTERDGPGFCDTIHRLHGLGDLEVRSRAHGSLQFLDMISSPPPHLLILRLFGRLGRGLPAWVTSLREVTKIKLLATELVQDAIDMLGELPSLVALHLWRKSYVEHELHLRAGKFRRLKLLALDSLDSLESLVVEKAATPHLEWLWLYRCVALRDGVDGMTGVMFLPRLKEIRLKCGDDKGQLEMALHRQVREHHNRPRLIV